MNGDTAVKTTLIGFRSTEGEKKRIQALATAFTGGDTSALLRQLVMAAESALKKHGVERTIWPPALNHFNAEAKTRQDVIDTKPNIKPGD
jgi:hypothetical protein